MGIVFDKERNSFTIQTRHTTYQMQVDRFGCLLHLYYGSRTEGCQDYLLTYYDRGFSGNLYAAERDRTYSMDVLPQEFPTIGNGDYRSAALVLMQEDGTAGCDLRYKDYQIRKGKYRLKGLPAVYAKEDEAQTLAIRLEDAAAKVEVTLLYGVLEAKDIITRSVEVRNTGADPFYLEKVQSACLDFLFGEYDAITFYGRHAMERNFQRTAVTHGIQSIGTRRGASSHQYNPMMILADSETTETSGACYALSFVYSGSFQGEVSKDQFNQTRVLMGLQEEMFRYRLNPEETFYAPEIILSYTDQGLNHLSNNLHRCIREHICRGKYKDQKRPVLINSWEAAYFDFSGDTIIELAKSAKELGIEMVVMDDGWFGNRNDDFAALGDWAVNEEKMGRSLGELIGEINSLGMKFGIWIEPEMVSEDSELYRTHPDWALKIPGRDPVRARYQLVLDFSRKEVVDDIFEQICNVLDQGRIEYVKWDMNRSISEVYSHTAVYQGNVMYDYVMGVYDLLERLVDRYPDILFEGCCGGGGRFDAGMLYYTPQIWCSDNTDAADRVFIQYGTSFGYPVSAVGAHVSAVPNHQTGRKTSLHTRGVTAMGGTFGYELNPALLSEEEKEEIRCQVQRYKEMEPLIRTGRYYRLTNPWKEETAAWTIVSEDRSEALLSVVMLEIHGNMTVNYIKLQGLDPQAFYQDQESKKIYHGNALMQAGLPMPVQAGQYHAYQFHFKKTED